ncbi:MAG TPA: superoxide dismutase [Gemmatimonadota bacterium]|nr:superoxide dismutase [Gemmatimonadota bacterium]
MAHEHTPEPLPYEPQALDGISRQLTEWHHDTHYVSYVRGRNAVEKRLGEMREKDDFTDVRGVKLAESHNASGQILHQIYYAILGGDGEVDPELAVHAKITDDFGSYENWLSEFKAVAGAARGWAITCYDPSDGRLHIYMADGHDGGAVWGAQPILPLDVWEHAYYYDQGPNRAAYIETFFANINWKAVDEYYRRAAGGSAG